MKEAMYSLYRIPEEILPRNDYLLELTEQCHRLEQQLRDIAEQIPMEHHMIIEAFLDIRDELELQSVKQAMLFVKRSKGLQ